MPENQTNHISLIRRKYPWSVFVSVAMFLAPSACQTQQVTSDHAIASNKSVSISMQAGHFLAARQADYFNDVASSADFYLAALQRDERNPELLQQVFVTQYRNGNIDMASALARQLETINVKVPFNVEPAIAQAVIATDWDAVIVLSDQLAEDITALPLASVIKSWALVANGQGDAGLAHLAEAGKILAQGENDLPIFVQVQLALMAEYLGYQDEASDIATLLARSSTLPAKTALQTAGILARSKQKQKANSLLEKLHPSFYHNQISHGQLVPPSAMAEFISNAIIDAALAYRHSAYVSIAPARLQLALYLDPNHNGAWFLLAQSWFELGQFNRAKSALAKIDSTGIWALARLLLLNDIDIR